MTTKNEALEKYKEELKKPVIAKIVVPLEENLGGISTINIECRTEEELARKILLVKDLGFDPVVERVV